MRKPKTERERIEDLHRQLRLADGALAEEKRLTQALARQVDQLRLDREVLRGQLGIVRELMDAIRAGKAGKETTT